MIAHFSTLVTFYRAMAFVDPAESQVPALGIVELGCAPASLIGFS
jgi:hypothetical protein